MGSVARAPAERLGTGAEPAYIKKGPPERIRRAFRKNLATTYSSTLLAVPSALQCLTSLFGMGRGGSTAL